MENEKTLRDELAMSMSKDLIPELKNQETIKYIANEFGLEWSDDDLLKQIQFALDYQAIIRYQYADTMIRVRG